MAFKDYYEARKFFQENRHKLTKNRARNLLLLLDPLMDVAVFRYEIEQVDELALDIEVFIDNIGIVILDPPAYVGHKSKECRPTAVEMKTLSESIEDSDDVVITILNFEGQNLMDEVEREVIKATLDHFDNQKMRTAKCLGICSRSLYNKIRIYTKKEKENADENVGRNVWRL